MTGDDDAAGQPIEHEHATVGGRAALTRDQAFGVAHEGQEPAIPAEGPWRSGPARCLGRRACGMGHERQRPRHAVEEVDGVSAKRRRLPVDQVGRPAFEGDESPVPAHHGCLRRGIRGRGRRRRGMAHQSGDAGATVSKEHVVAAIGIALAGHEVRRRAQEDDVPTVVADRTAHARATLARRCRGHLTWLRPGNEPHLAGQGRSRDQGRQHEESRCPHHRDA